MILVFATTNLYANTIDESLKSVMRIYHVPVVGYAIINGNKIVAAKTLSIDPNIKVTKHSLFQAASISKSVSAYGALILVEKKKLKLDNAANSYLVNWKIPANKFNRDDPVTLKQLLNMTSGLSVSGFAGYSQGERLPSLINILDGTPPANNAPIRVFYTPGSHYFYSGGSFQVLQQLIVDQSHQKFNQFMFHQVLKPLHMKDSLYQYPLPSILHKKVIPGFWSDGKMLKGGWNNYAIAASGGLWSTPTDLAKFAINIVRSYQGKSSALISKSMAQRMLKRGQHTDFGLGVVINGHGRSLNFRKNGHNFGYHCQLLMFPNTGQGIVMMTNSENGMDVINYMIPVIVHNYHMPRYFPFFDELAVIPDYV